MVYIPGNSKRSFKVGKKIIKTGFGEAIKAAKKSDYKNIYIPKNLSDKIKIN